MFADVLYEPNFKKVNSELQHAEPKDLNVHSFFHTSKSGRH